MARWCYYIVMRIGAFEFEEPLPDLYQPHALVVLRPWIDVSNVGSTTLGLLEEHLGAEPLGKLARPGNFFDFTRYRPTTRFAEGQSKVEIPNSFIRYAKQESGNDFLFLHLFWATSRLKAYAHGNFHEFS